jgi:hemerythrin
MLLDIKAVPVVAMDFMNEVHAQDVIIINKLYDLLLAYETIPNEPNAQAITDQFALWFEHTLSHFQGEEIQMREKRFPPYAMHKSEHDNVLAKMDFVFRTWNRTKDIAMLKEYVTQTLPAWFTQHIATMDTVTANFLCGGMSPCSAR